MPRTRVSKFAFILISYNIDVPNSNLPSDRFLYSGSLAIMVFSLVTHCIDKFSSFSRLMRGLTLIATFMLSDIMTQFFGSNKYFKERSLVFIVIIGKRTHENHKYFSCHHNSRRKTKRSLRRSNSNHNLPRMRRPSLIGCVRGDAIGDICVILLKSLDL